MRARLGAALAAAWVLAGAAPLHATATLTINNLDGAGEGFNDPTAVAPVGGNPKTTLGEQRLFVFQRAADDWGAMLNSTITIVVDANFDPLACSGGGGLLGQAGPNTVHRDFAGAPVADTYYVQALANALSVSDLAPASSDIGATFNSNLDSDPNCTLDWYYGVDGNPGTKVELLSVVRHELGHGLGFLSLVDLPTGAKFDGRDDAYMRLLENHNTGELYPTMTDAERVTASKAGNKLHWTGARVVAAAPSCLVAGFDAPTGHVSMYGPNPQEGGSSVSHWSTALSPNELMEPFYTGPTPNFQFSAALLTDTGWNQMPLDCETPEALPAMSGRGVLAAGMLVLLAMPLLLARRRRQPAR